MSRLVANLKGTACLLLALFALVSVGCGSIVNPTATPQPTAAIIIVTNTHTPRPARTLPPEFTPTPSPSPTAAPTATDTPPITPTPDRQTVCESFTWDADDLDGRTFRQGDIILVQAQFAIRDSLMEFAILHDDTGKREEFVIPSSESMVFDLLGGLTPGDYSFTGNVTTSAYIGICERSVSFTVMPARNASATPEPQREDAVESLLIEILTLIRDRLRDDTPTNTSTPQP